MTAGPRLAWLAEDAPPALSVRRPLAGIAEPACRGRVVRRQVALAVVSPDWLDLGGRLLALQLAHWVGPTRSGRVVVEAHLDHDAVARALSGPGLRHVPVTRLNEALALYDETVAHLGGAVLFSASCPVLWRQTRDLAGLS